MIASAADVTQDPNWNGTSTDVNTGATVPNLDSSMSFSEHQRIAFAARKLLVSFAPDKVTWPDIEGKDQAKDAFENLKTCYEDTTSQLKLKISKGIHQPLHDPHMQVTLSHAGGVIGDVKFHLNVSGKEIADKLPTLDDAAYHWEPHSFSCVFQKNKFPWPENAGEPRTKQPRFRGATRRNSVSYAGLEKAKLDHQNALDKAAFDERKSKVLGPALTSFVKSAKAKGDFPFVNSKNKEILYEKGRATIDGRTIVWNEAKKAFFEETA